MVTAVDNLHDIAALRLTDVQIAQILQRPQNIALCQRAAVFSIAAEDGQCRIGGLFHPLHGLADGIVVIYAAAGGLGRQEEQYVHAAISFLL